MSQDRVRIKGLSVHRPIIYGNTSTLLTAEEIAALPEPPAGSRQHTHKWTLAVRSAASKEGSGLVGGADDISHFIRRVTFKLWHGYTNPSRTIDAPPFEVTETGWGEFEVQIKIAFAPESGEKPIAFYHHLKIHHWSLDPHVPDLSSEQELADARRHGPVQSWQYDEIVFNDPFQGFYDKLLKHPPTRLPRNRKRPIPFHTANPTRADLEASRGGVPEFTQEMEVQEAQRLDYAVDVVTIETERWQNRLTEREKELDMLRQQLGED